MGTSYFDFVSKFTVLEIANKSTSKDLIFQPRISKLAVVAPEDIGPETVTIIIPIFPKRQKHVAKLGSSGLSN